MKQEQHNNQETPAQEQGKSMRTHGEYIVEKRNGKICIEAIGKNGEESYAVEVFQMHGTESIDEADAAYICEAVNNYERLKLESSKLTSTIQELKEVKELCIELSNSLKECMKAIWSEHPDGWKDVFLRHFKGHPYDKAESLIDRANKQLDTK